MVSPTYMTDCAACSTQAWRLDSHTSNQIRFLCNHCDAPASFTLTDTEQGIECLKCNDDTWSIAEKRSDHVMLECEGCSEITEVWLREVA